MHRIASLGLASILWVACADEKSDAAPAPTVGANTFGIAVDGSPFHVQRCQAGTVRVTQVTGVEEHIAGYWLTDGAGRQIQLASQTAKPNVTITEADKRVVTLNEVCTMSATKDRGIENISFDCRGGGRRAVGTAQITGCEAIVATR